MVWYIIGYDARFKGGTRSWFVLGTFAGQSLQDRIALYLERDNVKNAEKP